MSTPCGMATLAASAMAMAYLLGVPAVIEGGSVFANRWRRELLHHDEGGLYEGRMRAQLNKVRVRSDNSPACAERTASSVATRAARRRAPPPSRQQA